MLPRTYELPEGQVSDVSGEVHLLAKYLRLFSLLASALHSRLLCTSYCPILRPFPSFLMLPVQTWEFVCCIQSVSACSVVGSRVDGIAVESLSGQ